MKQYIAPHKTLIVGNGERPPIKTLLAYRKHAPRLLALDGAGDWLMQHDIRPDAIIGDLDSLSDRTLKDIPIIQVHDQNSNDLEKALYYCLENHYRDVTIMGAFGLRIDHFLTNIYVLKQFAPHLSINMVDEHQCAFICPKKQLLTFDNLLGAYISFFPLNDEVGPITSTGVLYPLSSEILSLNHRIGTLNRINETRATLYCEQGSLLVVVPQIFLPAGPI